MRRRPRRPQPVAPIIAEPVPAARRDRAARSTGPCRHPAPWAASMGPGARSPRQAAGRADDRGGPAYRPRLGGRRPPLAGGGGQRRPAGCRPGLGIRRCGHGRRQVAPAARPGVLRGRIRRRRRPSGSRRTRRRCRPGRGCHGGGTGAPTDLCRGTPRWPARSSRGEAGCSRVGGPTVVDGGGGDRTVDDALGRPVVRHVGRTSHLNDAGDPVRRHGNLEGAYAWVTAPLSAPRARAAYLARKPEV